MRVLYAKLQYWIEENGNGRYLGRDNQKRDNDEKEDNWDNPNLVGL